MFFTAAILFIWLFRVNFGLTLAVEMGKDKN